MTNRKTEAEAEAGIRFLEQCREFLGITGLGPYTRAWYRLLIFGVIGVNRSQVYKYNQVVTVEQGIIANAVQQGEIPLEYIEELFLDCSPACILGLFGSVLIEAISKVACEGRLFSLPPEIVAQFQEERKRHTMKLVDTFLRETTEPLLELKEPSHN